MSHYHSLIDIKNLSESLVRLMVGRTSDGYSGWSKDASHRRHAQKLGVFPDIWPGVDGPLPWRLTAVQRKLLDTRTGRIAFPHYTEPLYYRGASFFEKPSRMWKSHRKYRLLLFYLPVLLRDQVPALRKALLLFVWSLRRLEGKLLSE